MSRRFAVVHEAPPDFRTATDLADRELLDALPEWLTDDLLPHQRSWVDALGGSALTWTGLKKAAAASGVKARGKFGGKAGEADAAAARRALLYILRTDPTIDGIVLIRDQDDDPSRRVGLEQARTNDRSGKPIVIGLAVAKRECWVVGGFDPQTSEESGRFDSLRQALGFDPRERSHELYATDNAAPRSSKRVLRVLSQDDRDREAHCWRRTPLATLKERGGDNGLAAYLAEVRQHLAPLIGS